jgi:salicylate hydroxylase
MPQGEPSRRPDCLIAGAGIGGLCAALALARAGHRVILCDREKVLEEAGAGLQLSPNATRHLRRLGLLDDLVGIAVRPHRIEIRRAADGAVLTTAKLGETAERRFGAPFLVVHRGDLQRALLARLRQQAGIELRLDHALVDIRPAQLRITGLFETDGAEPARIEADLLIGADGLWSRARALAGLPAPSNYSGLAAWRTLIPREQAPLFARESDVHLWLGADAHLVHYAVRGGHEINVVAIIRDDWREEGWSAPGNGEILASRFARWDAKARALIDAAEGWKRWALIDRAPESRWSRERFTLLGDAAHPMLPFLAQGASQSIEDGFALADALNGADASAPAIATALQSYESARLGHTARVQRASRRQQRLYHLGGLSGRLRDSALRYAPADAILMRYAWIYRGSPAAGG